MMDHVLEAMRPHYEVTLECFVKDHETGQYKKLSDNPYYEEIKALIDSMNILRRYLGWSNISLKDELENYCER